jgi:ankyrin repeat protein
VHILVGPRPGDTALMWAAWERHPAAVKILLEHDADVGARSNFVAAANGLRVRRADANDDEIRSNG